VGLDGPKNHVLDGDPEMLRDLAMVTKFGTQFAITGFVRTIAIGYWLWRGKGV